MRSGGRDEPTGKEMSGGGGGSGGHGGSPSPNLEWRFNQTLRNVQGLVWSSLMIPVSFSPFGPFRIFRCYRGTETRSLVPMLVLDRGTRMEFGRFVFVRVKLHDIFWILTGYFAFFSRFWWWNRRIDLVFVEKRVLYCFKAITKIIIFLICSFSG